MSIDVTFISQAMVTCVHRTWFMINGMQREGNWSCDCVHPMGRTHNDWECLWHAIAVLSDREISLELNVLERLTGTELQRVEQKASSTLRDRRVEANG